MENIDINISTYPKCVKTIINEHGYSRIMIPIQGCSNTPGENHTEYNPPGQRPQVVDCHRSRYKRLRFVEIEKK